MRFLDCVCFTAFFILLKPNSVNTFSEEVKQLAALVVGDYYPVQDDLQTNVKRFIIKQVNLTQVDFGDRITFFTDERNDNETIRGNVLTLTNSGGNYTFQQHKILNVSDVANPGSIIPNQLQFLGHECDKSFTLKGSTYFGIHPACLLAPGPDGKPLVLQSTLNCTEYTLSAGGKKIIFRPRRRFILPKDLTPANPLC